MAKQRLQRFRKRVTQRVSTRVQNDVHDHTTTTSVLKTKNAKNGRVFSGVRLRVSQKQHDCVVGDLGDIAAYLDLLGKYEKWDAELVESGETVDTLSYIKQRAIECAKAFRAGGPLYGRRAEDAGEDWFETCRRVHGGACGLDRWRHELEMQKAKVIA
jgi:hypothetical protein